MSKQRRFNKRKTVLIDLAIAVVASSTVPLTGNALTAEPLVNAKVNPTIKSLNNVNATSEQTSLNIQWVGSDFNAGKNANNGKEKETPRPIKINLNK